MDRFIPVDTEFVYSAHESGEHLEKIARFMNLLLQNLLLHPVEYHREDSRIIIIRTKELVSYEDLEHWLEPCLWIGTIVRPLHFTCKRDRMYHDARKTKLYELNEAFQLLHELRSFFNKDESRKTRII